MGHMMDDEEREVAQAIVDYLVSGDDKIPSKEGTVTLHGVRFGRGLLPPPCEMRAAVLREATGFCENYEIVVTARRRSR